MPWYLNLIPVWFALAILVPLAWALGGAYRRFREKLPVTCPQTAQTAFVQVNTCHAMAMKAAGERIRRLQDCSHWPERRDCARECLPQLR